MQENFDYAGSTESAESDLESRLSLLSTSFMTPIGAGSKVRFLFISSECLRLVPELPTSIDLCCRASHCKLTVFTSRENAFANKSVETRG